MLNVPTKECGVCGATKPTSEFYTERRRQTPKWECKACTTVLARKYRRAHPERNLVAVQKNRLAHPEKKRAVDRAMHRKKQYRGFKVTQGDLELALASQNDLCAICQTKKVHLDGGREVHVDHCHKTQRFRGILCLKCNVMLAMSEDDPERLIRAAAYVRKHAEKE